MEKRLNARIEKYIREFKENIATKTEQVGLAGNEQADQLMQYIFDYDRLILEKDDFIKRKRVKNVVPKLDNYSDEEPCVTALTKSNRFADCLKGILIK